jgi:gliding motility-associated-like protein
LPSGPNAPIQSVSPAQDQTYTLTVTDNCGSPAVSTTVFVRVVPQSTADFAFTKPTICLNERATVNFTGIASPGAQPVWDFGTFTPQSGQGLGPYQLQPGSIGVQEVSLFLVQEGCTTATIRRSVEVVEVPVAQFTAPANQCLTGNSFSFEPSLPQNSLYTYTWRFNNGMLPTTVSGFGANNIQADTAGTYVAELEVRLGDCVDIARRSFRVYPTPPAIAAFTDSVCSGFQAQLTVLQNASTAGLTFEWFNRPDADEPVFRGPVYTTPRLDTATTFYVQGRSRFGCVSLNRTPVMAGVRKQEPIRLEAQSRVVYLPQAVVSLTGNVTDPNVITYYWIVGDRLTYTTAEPVFTLAEPGLYRVSLTTLDAFGCLNTVIENDFIEVREVFPLEIPTAFSPNGDLNNDEFWVRGANIMDFEFLVFNRMGNLVFTTRDLNFRWNGRSDNGTELQEGAYIYYVKGRTYRGVPFERSGSITLIR